MLVFLPLLCFVIIFLDLLAFHGDTPEREISLRKIFLQSALLWGGYLVVLSEILSMAKVLAWPGVVAGWMLCLSWGLLIAWRKRVVQRCYPIVVKKIAQLSRIDSLLLIFFGCVIGGLFVVAFISPPNNSDSLQYHMSRVVHWAQNRDLQHYATAYLPQLYNPIWAELAILNLRLLTGSDQLSNLVQWFSMIGSAIGVSAIAAQLGVRRKGQWAATAFAVSIPMGLAQATSAQNDYVTAFWLVCLLYFAVVHHQRDLRLEEMVSFALALGLGLLTKGTFYPYVLPVGLWFLIVLVHRHKKMTFLLKTLGTVGGIVVLVNLGFWMRNFLTFGGPLGSIEWVVDKTNSQMGIMPWIAAVVRNVMMHFVTPYEAINQFMLSWLRRTFGAYDPDLADFHFIWGWNHDDLAGSPLHIFLVFLTGLLLLGFRSKVNNPIVKWYAGFVLATFVTLIIVINYDLYAMRYHLPFLIAWSPIFGIVMEKFDRPRLIYGVVLSLWLCCIPWVLFNRIRPIIAMRDSPDRFTVPCIWQLGCTKGSILLEPSETILFGVYTDYVTDYLALRQDILKMDCRDIGLRIDSHDPEYIFWRLLNAPESGFRLETIYTFSELAHYIDPAFKPCAIICTICNEREQLHGLGLYGTYANVRLFVGSDYDAQLEDLISP